MTELVLSLSVALAAILTAVLGITLPRLRGKPARTPQGHEVILNLIDGSGVLGFLIEEQPGWFILRNARASEQDVEVPIDGEAWVPRERVVWVQVPTGGKLP